ncbi:hypothetical protein [Terriglobus sp. TAA 43]|uniref:hypothetical protein n=1 Tax=Terriglobus sp. TAA 43 TaxID=278961 RepID=UPI0012ED9CB7|nr:hypothetical protein [Terriglobus sp. TAA 43]
MKPIAVLSALFLGCMSLTGCVVVGYSTRTGFFFWQRGALITLVVVLVLWILLRNR